MTYGYEEALARRAAAGASPAFQGGSGYFAPRGTGLDPSLFVGEVMREDVRAMISLRFTSWAQRAGFRDPTLWSHLWVAGSGITPAWDATREAGGAPGDLDVMVGVDYDRFTGMFGGYRGSSPQAIAHELNQRMHTELWPNTAHTEIYGRPYELTYYVNDGVGTEHDDIRAINPYAAYDVTDGGWVVYPVEVPHDFNDSYFSDDARLTVTMDQKKAQDALLLYSSAVQQFRMAGQDIAKQRNAAARIHEAVRVGAGVFDAIHGNRHRAFGPGGKGYFDDANYRWQAGKGNGTISVVRAFKQLDEAAHNDLATPCDDADHLLLVAALANGGIG